MHGVVGVVRHIGHPAASFAQHFYHRADVLRIHVHVHFFKRLITDAVFSGHHDSLRAGNLKLIAFAPHGFDQNTQVQLSAPRDKKDILALGLLNPERDVRSEFILKPFPKLTGRAPFTFLTRKWGCVHAESHLHRWRLHFDHRKRDRLFRVRQRIPDLNIF